MTRNESLWPIKVDPSESEIYGPDPEGREDYGFDEGTFEYLLEYKNGYHIAKVSFSYQYVFGGEWYLMLYNQEYSSDSFEELEAILIEDCGMEELK